jgi:hypothetical protein
MKDVGREMLAKGKRCWQVKAKMDESRRLKVKVTDKRTSGAAFTRAAPLERCWLKVKGRW